ncbi:MAG: diphthine--ammonia ligase [Nitrososphaerales archaeon]
MNLASLYSGGKDSTFALYKALKEGHKVSCLITVLPEREDSLLFHYPNARYTAYQARCLRIPHISRKASCGSVDEELDALEQVVKDAKKRFSIDGMVTGGLASNFQKEKFGQVCRKLGLEQYAPNWGADQTKYMRDLLANNFKVMITGVSAAGLDEGWLGRVLDGSALGELEALSRKHGFNPAFEGGEAETLVLDCPIFSKRIKVREGKRHWDVVRGYFEILDVSLVDKEKEERIHGS